MNAIVCDRRDSVRLEEIERPAVSEDGVLVRVHASSVNPVDLDPFGAGWCRSELATVSGRCV